MSEFDPARLMRFVLEMRQAGVTDARTLSALERTPRTDYAPAHLEALAMDDVALPMAHGQAMTKPSLIGRVLMALAPQANDSVLEIGAGSGYQTAVLGQLAHKVTSLERWRDLAVEARARIGAARLMRVHVHCGDGADGWPAEAPYDRIVLNVAVPEIPLPLLDQLKPGGVLLAALVGEKGQRLVRYRNGQFEDLGPIQFAPLQRGVEEG
ncbi:MAG: protein-L-isoaspartate(D-aspartate) O-methyltransferase [Hyphomonadaceae bacterium]|nr:protein-L-isoaspartate(D-aspartate) O-methyltransferase [Hyphomonadaceae bacterium]